MSKQIYKLADGVWSFTDDSQPTDDPYQTYLMPGEVKELEKTRTVNEFFKGGALQIASEKELTEYQKKVEKELQKASKPPQDTKKLEEQILALETTLNETTFENKKLKDLVTQSTDKYNAVISELQQKLESNDEVKNSVAEKNEALEKEVAALKATNQELLKKSKTK